MRQRAFLSILVVFLLTAAVGVAQQVEQSALRRNGVDSGASSQMQTGAYTLSSRSGQPLVEESRNGGLVVKSGSLHGMAPTHPLTPSPSITTTVPITVTATITVTTLPTWTPSVTNVISRTPTIGVDLTATADSLAPLHSTLTPTSIVTSTGSPTYIPRPSTLTPTSIVTSTGSPTYIPRSSTLTPTSIVTSTGSPTYIPTNSPTSKSTATLTKTPIPMSVTASITSKGGTMQSENGKIQIIFPQGIVAGDPFDTTYYPRQNCPPDKNGNKVLRCFELEASRKDAVFGTEGNPFLSYITISIYYTHAELLAAGLDENNLVISFYSLTKGRWVDLPTKVDTVNDFVEGLTNHFTTFRLAQKSPAVYLPLVQRK